MTGLVLGQVGDVGALDEAVAHPLRVVADVGRPHDLGLAVGDLGDRVGARPRDVAVLAVPRLGDPVGLEAALEQLRALHPRVGHDGRVVRHRPGDADVLAGWLTEPDHSAHAEGIGAPATKEVLLGVDAEIGRLLDGLEERGVLSQTNIIVVSDHGFSTRTGEVSLTQLLVDAGLKESAQSLDVVVAGDAIHVEEGGDEMVATIVELLQDTDWVGPVFTRSSEAQSELGGYPGTVSFSLVGWDHERSADILMSPDWTDAENEFGFRGEVLSPGIAGHGSASPWDIRATFVAQGPGIKSFVASPVPTGNVDILPTVFELMGVPIPGGLDGRVLSEVLESGPFPGEVELETSVVETSTEVRGTRYELTIHQSRGGTSTYFDGFDVTRVPGG